MTEIEPQAVGLKDKIGQMVMCGFPGQTPDEGIMRLIRDYRIGGVVYFRRNAGTAAETARLSAQLRSAAAETASAQGASGLPLWIAVDQEGGMVARIDADVAVMPGNMALGAARDPALACETARASGTDLRRMGINFDFAPCLDVNNNPANPVIGVRSYGERPELVGELGVAAIRGYQAAGVSACAKHFPGHGDTEADSHHTLPIVPHDRERLARVELAPFKEAIAAGVDAIMTAHVLFPAYDASGTPATLSAPILGGLLRGKLGYDGVIVTDCLEMKAISETVGVGRGAVMAVKAGADVVLVSHRLDRQIEALEALTEAVRSGEIPEERIDGSYRRIAAMKRKREAVAASAAPNPQVEPHAIARDACTRAVTVVKNDAGALPLRGDVPTLAVWPVLRAETEVDERLAQAVTLGTALRRHLGDVREVEIGTEPAPEEIEAALDAARGRGQVVVGTYNAAFSPGQAALVRSLLDAGGAKVVVAALRNPYDLAVFPDVHAYAACYESRPHMLEALADVLAGVRPACGRLPVTVGEAYPYGFGLPGGSGID